MLFDFIKPKEGAVVPGLKYVPTSAPERDDDEDHVPWARSIAHGREFSEENKKILRREMKNLSKLTSILEIGVCKYKYKASSSKILMEEKPKDCVYLGVDILDKSSLNKPASNVNTIMCSSFERGKIKARLKELGVEKVDFLMIDGWHSINAVVNDWQFTEILSDNGVVLFHDTNAHTGPVAVLDAIDQDLWQVEKLCLEKKKNKKGSLIFSDWGIAVVRKQ